MSKKLLNEPEKARVAVITGAAGGIGLATSMKLLDSGFRVCLTDICESQLRRISADLDQNYDPQSFCTHRLDITDRRSIAVTLEHLQARWKVPDILVNNAGLFQILPFLELSDGDFDEMLHVNLLGTFRASQIFARAMQTQRSGKIINVASVAATQGAPRACHYAASKAALVGFTKSIAVELAESNIQVNAVLPGYIETEMLGADVAALKQLVCWQNPLKRLGQAWEVAEAVAYLAAAESTYLTGSSLTIDGGQSLG